MVDFSGNAKQIFISLLVFVHQSHNTFSFIVPSKTLKIGFYPINQLNPTVSFYQQNGRINQILYDQKLKEAVDEIGNNIEESNILEPSLLESEISLDAKGDDVGYSDRGMDDLVKFLSKDNDPKDDVEESSTLVQSLMVGITLIGCGFIASSTNVIPSEITSFFENPTTVLESIVKTVETMGPLGYVYFAAVYTVLEILAVPAIPLTASAGYLFGVKAGTLVVLLSASVAAAISFLLGRTFFRAPIEKLLEEYPRFKRLDKAIEKDGFRIMLLLRIAPIFPFALSNYLYGVTSVKFWPYFWGTMVGFTPGTIAYVYTGEIGKALTLDSVSGEPWYVYAGVLTLLSGCIKIVSDVATNIIENVEEEV